MTQKIYNKVQLEEDIWTHIFNTGFIFVLILTFIFSALYVHNLMLKLLDTQRSALCTFNLRV